MRPQEGESLLRGLGCSLASERMRRSPSGRIEATIRTACSAAIRAASAASGSSRVLATSPSVGNGFLNCSERPLLAVHLHARAPGKLFFRPESVERFHDS